MPKRTRRGKRGLRPADLAKMSNDQLSKAGFIRVAGFTRADGSKVKPHIRKLNPRETAVKVLDATSGALTDAAKYITEATVGNLSKALTGTKKERLEVADKASYFVPGVGEARLAKDSATAFGKGEIVAGSLLAVGSVVGLVPVVGDVAAKGLKSLAKGFKGSKIVKAVNKSGKEGRQISRLQQKSYRDPTTGRIVINKPLTKAEATLAVKGAKKVKSPQKIPTNKALAAKTKKATEARIAAFTKSDDYAKLIKRDQAIRAGTLKSPSKINRGKVSDAHNSQGFATPKTLKQQALALEKKVIAKEKARNLSLSTAKTAATKKANAGVKHLENRLASKQENLYSLRKAQAKAMSKGDKKGYAALEKSVTEAQIAASRIRVSIAQVKKAKAQIAEASKPVVKKVSSAPTNKEILSAQNKVRDLKKAGAPQSRIKRAQDAARKLRVAKAKAARIDKLNKT